MLNGKRASLNCVLMYVRQGGVFPSPGIQGLPEGLSFLPRIVELQEALLDMARKTQECEALGESEWDLDK